MRTCLKLLNYTEQLLGGGGAGVTATYAAVQAPRNRDFAIENLVAGHIEDFSQAVSGANKAQIEPRHALAIFVASDKFISEAFSSYTFGTISIDGSSYASLAALQARSIVAQDVDQILNAPSNTVGSVTRSAWMAAIQSQTVAYQGTIFVGSVPTKIGIRKGLGDYVIFVPYTPTGGPVYSSSYAAPSDIVINRVISLCFNLVAQQ